VESQTACSVCLVEFADGDVLRILPCLHRFHVSCVDTWLVHQHGVCPVCKADVAAALERGSGVLRDDDGGERGGAA
jgi:hypothetical protein